MKAGKLYKTLLSKKYENGRVAHHSDCKSKSRITKGAPFFRVLCGRVGGEKANTKWPLCGYFKKSRCAGHFSHSKNKTPGRFSPGRNLTSYSSGYRQTQTGSKDYSRSLPALRLTMTFFGDHHQSGLGGLASTADLRGEKTPQNGHIPP